MPARSKGRPLIDPSALAASGGKAKTGARGAAKRTGPARKAGARGKPIKPSPRTTSTKSATSTKARRKLAKGAPAKPAKAARKPDKSAAAKPAKAAPAKRAKAATAKAATVKAERPARSGKTTLARSAKTKAVEAPRKPAPKRHATARKAPARPSGATRTRSAAKAAPPDGLAFRLPETIRPTAYRLQLRVDPTRSRDYEGEVEIELSLSEAAQRVELHAADLRVSAATLTTAGGAEWPAQLEPRPERETVALVGDEPVPPGGARLRIAFAGTLRTDLRGLYGASAGTRAYAFSQLEAADARRFFPCFDEPAFKARFELVVETGAQLSVISNSPIERVEERGETKRVHFRETPLLSTYLVALAVGELSQSEPTYAGEVPIRIVHIPGNEHLTGFALEAARESLLRLADYFGIAYPYEKLDLVAVPDFEIGAMENAGAVFFRETLLLIDEQSVSLPEKKRAAEVICHELAHMWYGNLVTMRWWDDLWLNEAFATWMAFDVVAKWKPEWQMWNDFGHARNSALSLDALDNTHPIYGPVQTPAEATQNFDLITYEKGASVVRMLERYLGAATFQSGVRRYIARHREGNTVAADLWRALEEAAGESIAKVVRPFIEQPGFPLVRMQRRERDGQQELLLSQERFHAVGPKATRSPASPWAVPWVGRVGSSLVRHLLDDQEACVSLGDDAPAFVYGNADEGGFFRPLHHPDDLPALIAALPALGTSERLGFVHHQWALVRAGYAELDAFLELLPALAAEPDPDVLRALLTACDALVDGVAHAAGSEVRSRLQAFLARRFQPALDRIGWDTQPGDDNGLRLRRVELVALCAVIAEDPRAQAEAEARALRYLDDRAALDANLVAPLLTVAARTAGAARLARYVAASEQDPTPQERRRFRMALGDVRDPALVQQVLQLCLTPQIPTQDVALLMARLIGNPSAREDAFAFLCEHWDAVRARMPAMLVSRLIDALPALQTEAYRAKVQAFFAEHPVPTAERALRQADERFRLNATFRARAAPVLQRWLDAQGA